MAPLSRNSRTVARNQGFTLMTGIFITLEGGEGSGKSSQIRRLKAFLSEQFPEREVIVTREPGGTIEAEKIRDLLVNGQADKFTPQTEALLMVASRTEHVDKVIRPGLARSAIILCDRFSDSSVVYQGLAQNIDRNAIDALHKFAIDGLKPHRTYLLDLPPETGLERANKRAGETSLQESRFEDKGLGFHQRVRSGFLALAEAEPDRFLKIDALQPEDTVFTIIKSDILRIIS